MAVAKSIHQDNPPRELPPKESTRIRRLLNRIGYPVWLFIELGVFLAAWEFSIGVLHLANPIFLPPPSSVLEAMLESAGTGELWHHAAASARHFAGGYAAAVVVGVSVGVVMGVYRPVNRLVSPFAWALYSSPYMVFLPILAIWFGFGTGSLLAIVFLAAVPPILITTALGVASVSPSLMRAGQVFGGRWIDLQSKITLPSAVPFLVTGMKLAIPTAIIAMSVAEMLAAPAGLGRLVAIGAASFRVDVVFASLLLLILTSVSLIQIAAAAEARFAPWRTTRPGR